MTLWRNVRAAAAALMASDWEPASMIERLADVFVGRRKWMSPLVDALAANPRPRRERDLVEWILSRLRDLSAADARRTFDEDDDWIPAVRAARRFGGFATRGILGDDDAGKSDAARPARQLRPDVRGAAAVLMAGEWKFGEMYQRLAGFPSGKILLAHQLSKLPRPASEADLVAWIDAHLRELARTDPRGAFLMRAYLDRSVVRLRKRADGSYEAVHAVARRPDGDDDGRRKPDGADAKAESNDGDVVADSADRRAPDGNDKEERDDRGDGEREESEESEDPDEDANLWAIAREYVCWPVEMRESPWRVPALATAKELARWLGIGLGALTVYADRHGIARHYRYRWIAKRTGGYRLLEAPRSRLRQLQRYVLDDIVAAIPPHDAAHGYVAGRSVATFVAPHVGREVVIRVDLEAFFTSITAARVAAVFRAAGYPEGVARMLAALCTHRTRSNVLHEAPERDPMHLARLRANHLPQGAPTSGALANLVAYALDVRIAALATAIDARYTRYADDLVLSGDRRLVCAAPTLVARLGAIALEEGFALNFRKTRVMTRSTRQHVAGLVLNARAAPPRDELERLRAILHNCTRTGPSAQNRDGHPDFRAHLLGRISWVASVAPASGARLRAIFDRIRWQ